MNEPSPEAGYLEAIGLATRRFVGDFNDVLTAILATLSLAKQQGALSGETLTLDRAFEKAVRRGRDFTRQLRGVAKGSALAKKAVSLKEIILEATGSLLRGSNARLRCDLEGSLRAVQVGGNQVFSSKPAPAATRRGTHAVGVRSGRASW